MKFILLVAFVIACISVQVWANEDEEAQMQAAIEKCTPKEGVSEEELEQLKNGEFDDGNTGHKHIMCYVKCILEEFDALDGDTLKEDVFMEYFEPHLGEPKAKEYYDLCKGEAGDGECETPFKIIMCLRRSDDIFKF